MSVENGQPEHSSRQKYFSAAVLTFSWAEVGHKPQHSADLGCHKSAVRHLYPTPGGGGALPVHRHTLTSPHHHGKICQMSYAGLTLHPQLFKLGHPCTKELAIDWRTGPCFERLSIQKRIREQREGSGMEVGQTEEVELKLSSNLYSF